MASMRDIKRRKTSIQGTQQITKAMKLVSTVKLQRARAGAERSQTYFDCMYDTVNNILSRVGHLEHKYLVPGACPKKAVIVITSNRGLAGGYNSNVAKLITGQEDWKTEDVVVYAIGNKGREILERKGYTVKESYPEVIEEPAYAEAMLLSQKLLTSFAAGEIGEIYLAYTHFKNTVSHEPKLLKLLPVEYDADAKAPAEGADALMNFEPEDVEALDMIIPKYISSLIYGALMEAAASENGARMQAMDNATRMTWVILPLFSPAISTSFLPTDGHVPIIKAPLRLDNATSNAEDMISDLSLKYNRARQGSITQELTEIIP